MKTILYNPIFINPQAYYVFPRLTRYLQPDNESTAEPANYIGTIEVKVIAYGDTTLKRTYTNTDSIDLSEFKNTWIRISLFTKVGSCVLGEWKIGNMESDLPYIDPEVLASLKAVVIVGNKTNNDSDRAIVKNLVDASNPFVISNASYNLNSGYGKYNITFQHFPYRENIISINDNKVVFDKGGQLLLPYPSMDRDIPSFKVKVSGLSGTYHFRYYYRDSNGAQDSINMAKDGIYELPICYNVQSSSDGTNCGFANNGSDIVTIEQVPEFQGAFVTDGVNDTIISTKTVAEMGITDEVTVVSMIHQITLNTKYNIATTNYIENSDTKEHVRTDAYVAGKTGIYGYTASLINSTRSTIGYILGDIRDYQAVGTTNKQTILDSKFSVEGRVGGFGEVSSVAWYWTVIANKVLTADQINQVIAYYDLDRTLSPDIYCDVAKQGITNSNHTDFDDKLIDYSGNGRDIQLNNLAWDGDSGIGKYNYPNWKVNVTQGNKYARIVYYDSINGTYSANFKGITDLYKSYGLSIEIRVNRANTVDFHSIKEDGIYTITPPDDTTSIDIRFGGENVYNASCDITITQIPSHAGALCLDGVNGFGKVTGMPIYKDYTFIIDYERISYASSERWVAGVVSKSHVANQGAFILMTANTTVEPGKQAYSFGGVTSFNRDDFTRALVYQSKYKCGDVDLTVGEGVDSNTLWLGTFRDNDQRFFNGAIYSLMSFPYSMSKFLIERQLKKYKLGTLYPDMVEFRPVIKSNASYDNIVFYYKNEKVENGTYLTVGSSIGMRIRLSSSPVNEIKSITVNGIPATFKYHDANNNIYQYDFNLTSKSPQKINITIDEYIRFEDIVQPYPVLLRFKDENGNEVSWGGKFRVGSTITRIGSFYENNLIDGLYIVRNPKLNGNNLITPTHVVEKSMVFTCDTEYLLDNNEPKCILSPSRLRIPNSSYKLLGYIPDISGHGNHGVIHNSAYAEGSGVNEDGSYQFDGVDDFVTIPTVTGGKQVLMKVNWQSSIAQAMLYDQRGTAFAIWNSDKFNDNEVDTVPAYSARNGGNTYIDGILNKNILASQLRNITHNIVSTNNMVNENSVSPNIGCALSNSYYSQMSLYDFMLFDNISTEDKIKELNEYVGIEAKVELPPYYWDAYGKTNLDEDKATIQQRGVAEGDYDITNYNHAYDKMSGYGGYNLGRFDKSWASSSSSNTSIKVVQRNPYDITLKKLGGNSDWEFNNKELKVISNTVSVKFKSNKNIRVTCDYHYYPVGGNSEGTPLGITSKDLIANKDAIITISPISQENIDKYNIDLNRGYYLIYFQLSSTLAVNEEVTIEMLPLYPNGLVCDGVTDYSENANIPALTDFTYVFKRKLLDNVAGCASMTKGLTDQQRAVVIDYINTTGGINGTSFGNMAFVPSLRDSDIIYSTTTNINGTTITKGNNPDSNGIDIGKFATYYKKMVFYKLILYPKTIPLLQINFLKNLMERDEIIDLNNKIFIQE